jgi:hypothetical protein
MKDWETNLEAFFDSIPLEKKPKILGDRAIGAITTTTDIKMLKDFEEMFDHLVIELRKEYKSALLMIENYEKVVAVHRAVEKRIIELQGK